MTSADTAWFVAYTDGGARGNPGPAGFGVSVLGPDGAIAAELSGYLGLKTNNFAEYSALLAALDWALENSITRLVIRAPKSHGAACIIARPS